MNLIFKMIKFWLKESYRSMKRAGSSFLLSIITFTISVVLVFISFFVTGYSDLINSEIAGHLEINVFLKDSLDNSQIKSIEKELSLRRFCRAVRFIDKVEAEKNFIRETGDDFKKILDYNPLPESFSVILNDEYLDNTKIAGIKKDILMINGVEEVVYQKEMFESVLNTLEKIKKITLLLTGVLVVVSLIIIYSTLKLTIASRFEEFETIKLFGAKVSSIKIPVIINGVFIGIAADILGLLLVYLISNQISEIKGIISLIVQKNIVFGLLMLVFAPFSGFCISMLTLKKVSGKI